MFITCMVTINPVLSSTEKSSFKNLKEKKSTEKSFFKVLEEVKKKIHGKVLFQELEGSKKVSLNIIKLISKYLNVLII